MNHKKPNTRKRNKSVKIPPEVAEQGVNLLELLVELGGGARRKTRRRRKILKRR
jgi:hypothetical protein